MFLGFCEFDQKVYMHSPWRARGTVAQGPGAAQNHHIWLQGTDDLVQAKRKSIDLKLERKLNFHPLWFQIAAKCRKLENQFCVELNTYFKITNNQNYF